MVTADEQFCRGRRRDASIDRRVLTVASRHLAERGFAAISIAAIADEAATTRQALYRRWPTKQSLVSDAIRFAADTQGVSCTDNPRADLVRELDGMMTVTGAGSDVSLAGAMLQSQMPQDTLDCYRSHVLEPRQQRIRDILVRAQELDLIDRDADLDAAVAVVLGAGYVVHLAGTYEPDWASRTALLVWRAVGGAA
jgi:AcrR family transcriptional regulator